MVLSFFLIIIASLFLGTFGLGMKYNKPLAWEAFWAVHAVTGMLIVPLVWALIVIPGLFHSILASPSDAVFKGMLFGFIWGIGGVTFGISVRYVGVSLTYGVVMGTTGAIGGLVPLIQMDNFASQKNFPLIILGVLIMLTGVAIIARAGLKREKILFKPGMETVEVKKENQFVKGLFIVSVSGVFSSFINIGFANALPIAVKAVAFGASPINSGLASWVVVLWGAAIFNLAYSIALLIRNNTWGTYTLPKTGNAVKWAVVSAVLWFGSLGIYGLGAAQMGTLGTVIGWPVFVGLSLIFSNFWAVRAGEWKGAKQPKAIMLAGIAVLIIATIILAVANLFS